MIKEEFIETIKCDDYEVFNIEYHKKRIINTIGINICLEEYIYPLTEDFLKCKVLYNQDGIIDITYSKYIPKDIHKFRILIDNDINYNKKSANRESIDNLYKLKEDYDEIIIVKNGYITDTSIANIAILIDNIWYTPKSPLLNGTTKQRYLDNRKIIEKDIDLDLLYKAEKIALMNAMIDFKVIDEFSLSHL